MKFNEKEIASKAYGKGQMEGRLNYRKNNSSSYYQAVFKERWFKLIDNCLFYFRINDAGSIAEKEPSGVLVLENASVQLEHASETPFAFSVSFVDEPEKRHMFSGMSESSVAQWVIKLRCAPYEYLRSQLHILQSKIYLKTGMDPLLMVPRNEGSMKWAPGEPLPVDIAHHDKGDNSQHINVFRSKSSVSVFNSNKVNTSAGLERSRTTVHVFTNRHNPFNSKDFKENSSHSSVQHLRPAPSPPIRKRSSPKHVICNDVNSQSSADYNMMFSNDLDTVLQLPPKPPSRKNSPRQTPVPSGTLEQCDDRSQPKCEDSNSEDLIQF